MNAPSLPTAAREGRWRWRRSGRGLGEGVSGAGDLQLSGPEGVCVDAGEAGLVYVADVYNHRVIYDHSTRV